MLSAPTSLLLLLLYLLDNTELFYRSKNVYHFDFGMFNTFFLIINKHNIITNNSKNYVYKCVW